MSRLFILAFLIISSRFRAKGQGYPESLLISSDGPAATRLPELMGQYDKIGNSLTNGRPVWKQKGGNWKLFYKSGWWVIGKDENKLQGLIASSKRGQDLLNTNWMYYYSDWQQDEALEISEISDDRISRDCFCGLLNRQGQSRILGGRTSKKNKYPWMVSLHEKNNWQEDGSQWCGGSLINSLWVLTAAHCVDDFSKPSELEVFLGDHDTEDKSEEQEVKRDISKIIIHPKWDSHPLKWNYDIALLKMKKHFDFTNSAFRHIRPICLPKDSSEDYVGWQATLAGWGRGSPTDELQEIDATIDSNSQCSNWFYYFKKETMLCVKYDGGKQCGGDSGGPLITKSSSQNYEVIGVVNSSRGGCQSNALRAGVFARVTEYLDWIDNIVSTTNYTTCYRG